MANTLKNVINSGIGDSATTLYTVPDNTTTILIGMTMANTLTASQIDASVSVIDTSAETSYIDSGASVATITSDDWGFVDTFGGAGAELAFSSPSAAFINAANTYMTIGSQLILKYAADSDQLVTIEDYGLYDSVYTPGGGGYVIFDIVGSLNSSNQPTSLDILGDVEVTVQSEAYIVKNATIAPGGALVPIGGEQKVILETGDVIKVQSSDSASLDVIASIVEQT
jgi:hypothetical protein